MNPSENYFALFGLPTSFELDATLLTARYRDLQRAVHPDRFAAASEKERLLSVQQAARINDAFDTLRAPLPRARYLLALRGVVLDDQHTVQDGAFLMEQMELREAMEEARRADDALDRVGQLIARVEGRNKSLLAALTDQFRENSAESLQRAGETVRKLQFLKRLLDQLEALEADLENP